MKKNTKLNKANGNHEKDIINLKNSNINFKGAEKKKKVSKKGKKNWRKNIDTTDIDKQNIKKLDENILKSNVQNMKNEDLFIMDVLPNETARQKLIREKAEKKQKKVKKLSMFEERKIKKLIKNKESIKNLPIGENKIINEIKENTQKVYDLWADEDKNKNSIFKFPNNSANANKNIQYPKIPLPHPGQSYNPSTKDIKNLIDKVVEFNKHLVVNKQEDELNKQELPVNKFPGCSDSEEEDFIELKVSNNPPVDDSQRKTKKERKKLIEKKLKMIKEKEIKSEKEKRKELGNAVGIKRVEKQQRKLMKEKEQRIIKEIKEKKEKERLIKLGLIEDKELLEEFVSNPDPVPLRKLRSNNQLLADRFTNIIKRNVIGEYSTKIKKRNRKLDKIHYKDNNNDYEIFVEEDNTKLKIFE